MSFLHTCGTGMRPRRRRVRKRGCDSTPQTAEAGHPSPPEQSGFIRLKIQSPLAEMNSVGGGEWTKQNSGICSIG
jgi:hypothetical protein